MPRAKVIKVCAQCSQPFTPTFRGQPPQRFCSRRCYWKTMIRPIMDRFIESIEVNSNGCWIWTGRRDKDGYGRFSINGHYIFAHRIAWMLASGPIPKDLNVLHRCDTPSCVRPKCLFVGTDLDNQQDCAQKGRKPHGAQHWNAKLTAKDVEFIRASSEAGRALARHFHVQHSTIQGIRQRRTWRHVV